MTELTNIDPGLYNHDLAPATAAQRTWTWRSFSALWVGMVVCIPTYTLAGGLISSGLSAMQAVLLVFLGNIIVLVPMLLTGAMGTKYGVPFPVLLRSSFGPRGAQVAALARALVACGWFGINTWLGGSAIYVALNLLSGNALAGTALPLIGIDAGQLACFLAFWALHLYFIRNGTESIRWLEQLSAPFLIVMGLALLYWAYVQAHGFGQMLSAPATTTAFWPTFIGGLTAMVGFWATMALNICDFTRFSRSQRDQVIGQALGLPLPMALFAFIGVAVTSATVVVYGKAIWNPVDLAAKMGGMGVVASLFVLLIATLTTNIAANVVSPAYDFSNFAPSRISFRAGGYITAGIGIAIFPWKLLESASTYIFSWLIGYSALLGPIAGIMIADYYLIRRRKLSVDALFQYQGRYRGTGGWNLKGLAALAIGIVPNLPGFAHSVGLVAGVAPIWDTIFTGAWFVGFFLAAGVYILLNLGAKQEAV
jgi:NCS1 family nucleobase:cation symporter-1